MPSASMLTGVLVSSDSRIDRFSSARGQSTLQSPPSPFAIGRNTTRQNWKLPSIVLERRKTRVRVRRGRRAGTARRSPTPPAAATTVSAASRRERPRRVTRAGRRTCRAEARKGEGGTFVPGMPGSLRDRFEKARAVRSRKAGPVRVRYRLMRVRFWGVRGSVPWSTDQSVGHGCNTPASRFGDERSDRVLILDAGSGIVGLERGARRHARAPVPILLSHYHWDHMQGCRSSRRSIQPGWYTGISAPALAGVDAAWVDDGCSLRRIFPVPFARTALAVRRSRSSSRRHSTSADST